MMILMVKQDKINRINTCLMVSREQNHLDNNTRKDKCHPNFQSDRYKNDPNLIIKLGNNNHSLNLIQDNRCHHHNIRLGSHNLKLNLKCSHIHLKLKLKKNSQPQQKLNQKKEKLILNTKRDSNNNPSPRLKPKSRCRNQKLRPKNK